MILESIMAVVSGGATGLLGSLISDVSGYFANKSKYEFDLKMGELSIRTIQAETDASVKIAKSEQEMKKMEADARVDEAEIAAFIETGKSDTEMLQALAGVRESSLLLKVAVFIRTMVRPILTLYLCLISTWMYIDSYDVVQKLNSTTGEQTVILVDVYRDTTNNVLYLTSAAVLFWFGQRKKKD